MQLDETNIRVAATKLDKVVNLVGEMVISQARLHKLAADINNPALLDLTESIGRLTDELRETSINLRMIPIGTLFKKFSRLVHDLAQELNKEVELVISGEETELDKSVIEKLYEPVLHLIRNSIDHGIEAPEERVAKGKPRTGHLYLSAVQSGPDVIIGVKDDGNGLNKEKIKKKAVEQGLLQLADNVSEKQLGQFLFLPGFSTADKLTNISGRGVGLDVVKANIELLRGSVDLSSTEGEFTKFQLKIPLTLAIIDGLLFKLHNEYFIIPLSTVSECIDYNASSSSAHDNHILNVRGEVIPFINLREYLGIFAERTESEQIVLIKAEDEKSVGLIVDEVIGQHQTVVKPVGDACRDIQEISGATILGDGTVALILDPGKVIDACKHIAQS